MDNIYIKFICIIFILFAHLGLLNKLEKSFINILFDDNSLINRPLNKCKNSNDFNIYCLGMPSGHTEVATIISLLLIHYDLLDLPVGILTIIVVGLQRLVSNMHNIQQVLFGLIFGLAYTYFYIKTNCSIKSILIISGLILFLILILTLYVDNIIQNDKIPDWVDKKLYPIIEKKKNVPFYIKYGTIVASFYCENIPLFIDYKTLEMYLDICINKINNTDIKYDAIVGIKSGGAIISNYIAQKLNIKNYSVKITSKTNECNSFNIKAAEHISNAIQYKEKIHKLCEGIDDNLENKNVILIDEMVYTGSTMEYVASYLTNEKKVKNVYLITISSYNGSIKLNNIPLNYATDYKMSMIYPWGYDN
jgi:adenine/guanine phosphoribosyltransferase-like PRPP-binding protein